MSQPSQNPNTHEVVVPVPKIGDRAPTLGDAIHFPRDKPVLVVFLRHCGCPCKSSLPDSDFSSCITAIDG